MSYTSDTGAFAFFQTSKIRLGEGSREVVYREDEEKMRLAKLVFSVTAFAVSTVFAGDSLLNFDKTDPTATCILTAESPSPKYVLILFPGGDGRVAAHLTGLRVIKSVFLCCSTESGNCIRMPQSGWSQPAEVRWRRLKSPVNVVTVSMAWSLLRQ